MFMIVLLSDAIPSETSVRPATVNRHNVHGRAALGHRSLDRDPANAELLEHPCRAVVPEAGSHPLQAASVALDFARCHEETPSRRMTESVAAGHEEAPHRNSRLLGVLGVRSGASGLEP